MPGCQSVVSAAQRSAHRTAFRPCSGRCDAQPRAITRREIEVQRVRERQEAIGERRRAHATVRAPWLQRYGRATNTPRERLPTAP